MDFLQYAFLEQPFVLLPLLAVGTYVCLVIWLRRRTGRARRALRLALVLCLVLPIIQKLVKTDRELIRSVCEQIARAIENDDVDTILKHVAGDFQMYDIDRSQLRERAQRAIDRFRPKDIRYSQFQVEVTAGDRANVKYVSSCTVTGDPPVGRVSLSWTAVFAKEDGVWRLKIAEAHGGPLQPDFRLQDVL